MAIRSTAGALKPVVSTPIEASALISPRLKAAMIPSRSSFGVLPKMVAQLTPRRRNASATWVAWRTPEQKASQDLRVSPWAILAQSVGGGGGAVLSTGNAVATQKFSKGSGNAADVTVTVTAPIGTTGAGAHGVVAQSVAGGGGLVTSGTTTVLKGAGGTGTSGLVTVHLLADVVASGAGANAVFAQSTSDPIINVESGVSLIGGVGGAAVVFDSPINVLNNRGNVGTVDGAIGLAVQSISGDTTISNEGRMLGSFQLFAGGTNSVRNTTTGTLFAGPTLDLGGGVLQNDGILQSGGANVGAITINGSFDQSPTGSLVLRVDPANNRSDTLTITGPATLKGELKPVLVDGWDVAPGTVTLANFVTAGGGLDVSGLTIVQSAIMKYAFTNVGGVLSLTSTADFRPSGLSGGSQVIAGIIGNAQTNGLPHFATMTAQLAGLSDVKTLDQAYYDLGGAAVASAATVGAQMTTSFLTTVLNPFSGSANGNPGALELARSFAAADSRPAPGPAQPRMSVGSDRVDPYAGFVPERMWSIWAQAYGGYNRTGADSAVGAGDTSARVDGLATGFDHYFDDDAMLGFSLGVGSTNFGTSNGTSGRSDVVQAGVYGSKQFGRAYLSAALSYAVHDSSTTRELSLAASSYKADFQANSVGGRFEAGYRLPVSTVGITPYAAAQVLNFRTASYVETPVQGADPALALRYDARSSTATRFEFGVMLDRRFALDEDRTLAIGLRAAWAHDHSENPDVVASFQSLPGSSFGSAGPAPVEDWALLSAGAELRFADDVSAGVRFDGEFSGRSETYGGMAMLRYRW